MPWLATSARVPLDTLPATCPLAGFPLPSLAWAAAAAIGAWAVCSLAPDAVSNYRRDLYRLMEAAGFQVLRTGKHLLWGHPCGARVVTSQSPSDHRAIQNCRQVVRKELARHGHAPTC